MSASPIAVPSRACRLSRADLSWPRSVVGLTSVTGSEAKATMPTRTFSGSWLMNDWADARAASSRVGETSVARMEPETSRVRMTVASSRGTGTIIVGRASPMSSAAMAREVQDGRQVAAPGRALRGDVGEQREVREADRVLAAAALRPEVEADGDRDRGGGRGASRERGKFMRVVLFGRGSG